MDCQDCEPSSGCPGCRASPARRAFNKVLLVLAAIVAAAVVAWSLFGGGRADDAAASAAGGGSLTGLTIVDSAAARVARIVIEAEGAFEVGEPFSLAAGDTGPSASASGGSALYVGPEKFNDNWNAAVQAGDAAAAGRAKGHPDADYPGFARFNFTVPKDGDYRLWVRGWWVDDCGNSVAVCLDDGPLFPMTDTNYGRWVWTPLTGMGAKPIELNLAAGPHTLTLINREDDCFIDQILLRDARANVPDPDGIAIDNEQ